MHVRVLFKQPGNPLIAKLSDFPANGYRDAGQGVLPFDRGQGQKSALLQPVIEALSLCGQEIEAVIITVHHINGRGDRKAFVIHRCHDGRMNYIHDICQIIFRFHIPLL